MTPSALTPHELIDPHASWARLDVREAAAFDAGHLEGSGQIEPHEFLERRAELPPRDQPVAVLADDATLACDAALVLEEMGYSAVGWLAVPLASVPGGHATHGHSARLWRPSPFLESVLPDLPPGRAVDLAAGSGREAVFLALHGYDVEAWDHAPEALDRARRLAARHGVELRTVVADLERDGGRLPSAQFNVVTCFRFLHRPLFPHLARAVAPGGCVVYETYRVGQERFGRPRQRRFLLNDGELPEVLPGFEVLRYEEPSPEAGPITARLLARKAAEPGEEHS